MAQQSTGGPLRDDERIPSVDLGRYADSAGRDRRRIAGEVDEICRSIGFLVIENHGVPPTIVDAAWTAAGEFFDLPVDRKLAARASDPGCPRATKWGERLKRGCDFIGCEFKL